MIIREANFKNYAEKTSLLPQEDSFCLKKKSSCFKRNNLFEIKNSIFARWKNEKKKLQETSFLFSKIEINLQKCEFLQNFENFQIFVGFDKFIKKKSSCLQKTGPLAFVFLSRQKASFFSVRKELFFQI